MALTFPSSPTNGQIYADTVTGNRYVYDSAKSIWKFAANNVGMSVSSTPPSNVAPGAMWFNREIGRTFVYYDLIGILVNLGSQWAWWTWCLFQWGWFHEVH